MPDAISFLMQQNDGIVAFTFVKGRKRFPLLPRRNEHSPYSANSEIRRQRQVHQPVSAVLVEDKANGPAVIPRLKADVPEVIGINPQGGKVARMYAAAPEWQAGDWYLPRNAAWTEAFIEQITSFPNARHDDMVNAMTQASAWLLARPQHQVVIANAFTGEILQEVTW
jgi:predicted phage terminase large subunit-like protein